MRKLSLLLALVLVLSVCVPVSASETETEFYFTNVYEDFESYVAEGDTLGSTSGPALKDKEMTGGTGWNGAWYDNANGTITGGHKLTYEISESYTNTKAADLYTTDTANHLSRKLATAIDFIKEGMYTITINAQPSNGVTNATTFPLHNMSFELGDKIAFGTKYVEGSSVVSTNPYYYAHLNGQTLVNDTDKYKTYNYHKYVLVIKADGTGKANLSFSIDGGTPLTAILTNMTSVDTLTIRNGGGTIKVSDISIVGEELPDEAKFYFTNISEDFESYVTAEDTDFTLKGKTLNGGTGWNGAWYDNANETVTGSHVFKSNNSDSTKYDVYSYNFHTNPLSRKLETPIDFSQKGKYAVTINAMADIYYSGSPNFTHHNLSFELGDKIKFGTKYVEGKSVDGTNPMYYPHLTAGDTVQTGETGFRTQNYYEYSLLILADGNGNATLAFSINDSLQLVGNVSGLTTVDTFKINNATDSNAPARICDISITGSEIPDLSAVRAKFTDGTNMADVIAEIRKFDKDVQAILFDEYNNVINGKHIYEDFEDYADASDEVIFTSSSSNVKLSDIDPINGGIGWGGAWRDSTTDQISGGHQFRLKYHNYVGSTASSKTYREIDLYSTNLSATLKRQLATPVDFSQAGEYYIKISAQPAISPGSGNFARHGLTFSLGDDISFGTKYVEGESYPTTDTENSYPYYFPHLTVGDTIITGGKATTGGIHTSGYYTYVLKIVTDGNGKADVTYTLGNDITVATSVQNLANAEYFSIFDNQNATAMISEIQIERYTKSELDAARGAITAYLNGTGTKEAAFAEISKLEVAAENALTNELMAAEGKKMAYEDFESYADPTDKSIFTSPTKGVALNTLDMNGGGGWNGPWYDSDGKVITGGHQLCTSLSGTALDLYSAGLETKPLMRDFAVPVDFSRKGEYFFKINAMASISWDSVNFAKHNLTFSIGDAISFGTKYVEGKSDNSTSTSAKHYFPHFTAGSTAYVGETSFPTSTYHSYILHIVSNGDGSGKAEYKLYRNGGEVTPEYFVSADLTGMQTLDYIKIADNTSSTARVADLKMEFYEFDTINPANEAIAALAEGSTSYDAAFAEVDKITGIAKEQLMAELKDNQGYIEVRDGEFMSGDGLKLLDTSKISDSVVYSFKLYNNYKAEKNVNVFMGVFYDGKLAGVKTLPVTLNGRGESESLTLGYADALPEGKFDKISVKVLVWDKDTLVPFTDRIDMYSQDSRAVTPEIFGADTTEPVVVAFMGDSITHLYPSYTKWIEYYYRIKYPTKDIKFVSKGISGDTAGGNEDRFEWDILDGIGTGKPTEACIMIGMNDVNRSLYPNVGTDDQKQRAIDNCLTNIADIADLCEENNIKLTLITPTLYDEANFTNATSDNKEGVNAALGKIAEGVIKLANERKLAYIDFYGYINSFNSTLRAGEFAEEKIFNVTDRIHATPEGTFAAGFIFIDQQINDPIIASVDINANTCTAETDSATATNITYTDGTLSYTYKPASIPMYKTEEYELCNDTYGIPVTDSINREIIKATGLEEGNYKIMFGDAEIGTYTAAQLAEGVNIATVATNPGYVQSKTVYDLVTSKTEKDYVLRDIAFVERYIVNHVDSLSDVEACIKCFEERYSEETAARYVYYPANKRAQKTTISEIETLEDQAKEAAQPKEHTVQIIKQ